MTETQKPPSTSTRKLGLRTRMTLMFVVAGAVPLGLLGATTLRIQRDGLEHAEQLHEFAVIDHVTDVIERDLREASEAAHRVGVVLTDGRIGSEDAQLDLARETMANASTLARVSVYLADGTFVDSIVRRREDVLPPAAPRLAPVEIPEGRDGVWLPPEFTPSGVVIQYVEPVMRNNERRAWVVAMLRPKVLSEAAREISLDRFENRPDGVLVIDENTRVLASGVESGPLAVGSTLAGKDLLSVTNIHQGDFTRGMGLSAQFKSGNEAMVGTFRTVPSRRWAVLARRPAESVFAALSFARRSLAIAGVAFLVFALLVSAFLAGRTVRPIRMLMDLARSYGQRKFSARSTVMTGDELEQLGDGMMHMAGEIERSEAEILRRAQVEANLARFMPASVAQSVASGAKSLELGGERRSVTIMFADVASFTPFAEATEPERVVQFLNELFGVMTEVVFRHEGTVDKFVGDCVMAVFGAPTEQADHAEKAVTCAEDLHRFVEASGSKWKEKYGIEPKLAIGVNSGEALVGNLGSETRMEYTCIGDVVNVAARLEGMARPGQTLVTAETVKFAGDSFEFSSLGEHSIRGKKQAVQLFELER